MCDDGLSAQSLLFCRTGVRICFSREPEFCVAARGPSRSNSYLRLLMAPLPEDFSYDHYSAVYNALSFGALASCVDALMCNGVCAGRSKEREKHGRLRS